MNVKTYQFKTHCEGDIHSSKTANIFCQDSWHNTGERPYVYKRSNIQIPPNLNTTLFVKFLVNQFRGYGVLTPINLPFTTDLLRRPYNIVRTAIKQVTARTLSWTIVCLSTNINQVPVKEEFSRYNFCMNRKAMRQQFHSMIRLLRTCIPDQSLHHLLLPHRISNLTWTWIFNPFSWLWYCPL